MTFVDIEHRSQQVKNEDHKKYLSPFIGPVFLFLRYNVQELQPK
jgi:hypothetical protein